MRNKIISKISIMFVFFIVLSINVLGLNFDSEQQDGDIIDWDCVKDITQPGDYRLDTFCDSFVVLSDNVNIYDGVVADDYLFPFVEK